MGFNDVLQRRYSCRSFAPKAVEGEKVGRILEAGRGDMDRMMEGLVMNSPHQ